jgi:hypothetical protein
MSWTCKFQSGENCLKRKKPCKAGSKGCVLEGKFAFLTPAGKTKAKRHRRKKEENRDGTELEKGD